MGLVIASKSLLTESSIVAGTTAADFSLELLHSGAGSSSVEVSLERARTRQLADACRIEHSYPGSTTDGTSIIRIRYADASSYFGTGLTLENTVAAMLSIDCENCLVFTVWWRALDSLGAQVWASPTRTVLAVGAGSAFQESCAITLPPAITPAFLDLMIRPVLYGFPGARTLFIDVGRVWLSHKWESSFPIAAGWEESFEEAGVKGYSRGRQAYGDSEKVYRVLTFGTTRMSAASKDDLKNIINGVGLTREFLMGARLSGAESFLTDPAPLYGSFSQAPKIDRQGGPYFRGSFAAIEEY